MKKLLILVLLSTSFAAAQETDGETGSASANTRQYEGAYGTAEIPTNPQRVVVTAHFWLEPLLALGVPVIGAPTDASTAGGPATAFTLSEGHSYDIGGITSLGSGELNLEAVLALAPDLIIQPVFGEDNLPTYEQLSLIAPVAAIDWGEITDAGGGAPEIMEVVAEVVGADEAFTEARAQYDQAIDELRAVAGEYGDDLTISVFQKFLAGEFSVRPDGLAVLTVMKDAGLHQLESQALGERQFLSFEVIPEHDADVIVVSCAASDPEVPGCLELTEHPLFQRLSAVQKDQVEVMADLRFGGAAYRGLIIAANELTELLSRDLDVSGDYPSVLTGSAN